MFPNLTFTKTIKMGLSIHYSGRISKPELLPALIEEVEEIVKIYQWPYDVFERHFPPDTFGKKEYNDSIYGISFTPANCETIPVCFLSNGRISDIFHLDLFGRSKNPKERKYVYMLSVKTQFAGIEIHSFIIELFRYLNKKYFAGFKMIDEGSYWETHDKELLEFNFKKYNMLINAFSSALENYPMLPDENVENYVLRLLNYISKNK
jgi:hypothetical protein